MQDSVMQFQALPFVKLVQANMDLLTRFWGSREVTPQATVKAGDLLQQATESTMHLMQTGAFANLCQGMLKNYTDFLMEASQGGVTIFSEAQAAWMRQAQEASNVVVDATEVQARRARRAA